MEQKTKICNLCGKELDIYDEQQGFNIHTKTIFYGSEYDGLAADLTFCCDCFDKLAAECKVSPILYK